MWRVPAVVASQVVADTTAAACAGQRVMAPSSDAAASRVLELERELRERNVTLEQAEERARQAERRAEELLGRATDREDALLSEAERLLRRAEEAEARAEELRRGAINREAALLRQVEQLQGRAEEVRRTGRRTGPRRGRGRGAAQHQKMDRVDRTRARVWRRARARVWGVATGAGGRGGV